MYGTAADGSDFPLRTPLRMETVLTWERARHPEQKRERRTTILAAAARLFDEGGVDGASLSAIARAASISKANVYRYFESREAIFLELLVDEQEAWERDVRAGLADLEGRDDIDAVATLFATVLVARPRMCALMASLASVLEHNIGEETVANFKRRFAGGMLEILPVLQTAVPSVPFSGLRSFLMHHVLHAAGTWPHAHPSPVVESVLRREEFAGLRVEFADAVRSHACALLRGLARH